MLPGGEDFSLRKISTWSCWSRRIQRINMRGLSEGAWQIVSTAFDNVLGWSGREGAEIVAIAQVSQGIALPVYVRPEIKSWTDLRGKKLAVDAVDTAYALVLRRIILEHGLDFDRGDY